MNTKTSDIMHEWSTYCSFEFKAGFVGISCLNCASDLLTYVWRIATISMLSG